MIDKLLATYSVEGGSFSILIESVTCHNRDIVSFRVRLVRVRGPDSDSRGSDRDRNIEIGPHICMNFGFLPPIERVR
jgi:hypothetical protein